MLLVLDSKANTIHRWQPDFKGSATLTHEIKADNLDYLDKNLLDTLMIGTSPTMVPFKAQVRKVVGKLRK